MHVMGNRVFSSMSKEPMYIKLHFKIFSPCMPLLGVDLSPGISFTSSGELNHSGMISPLMNHFEVKDFSISTHPELAQT